MNNRDRAASVADLARMFASKSVAPGETEETIAADMIGNLLHWVMRKPTSPVATGANLLWRPSVAACPSSSARCTRLEISPAPPTATR